MGAADHTRGDGFARHRTGPVGAHAVEQKRHCRPAAASSGTTGGREPEAQKAARGNPNAGVCGTRRAGSIGAGEGRGDRRINPTNNPCLAGRQAIRPIRPIENRRNRTELEEVVGVIFLRRLKKSKSSKASYLVN